MIVIHDKINHSKTSFPHFSHKSKHMDLFMKLPIYVTGMIAHGHKDAAMHIMDLISSLVTLLTLPVQFKNYLEIWRCHQSIPLVSSFWEVG